MLAAFALRRIANELRPDIIHAHYLTHYGWITWASGKRPYVMTLWGSDILLDAADSVINRTWARVVLRGASLVTADSGEVIDRAIRLGASPGVIREVQFGVDSARFRPGRAPETLARRLTVEGRRVVFSPRALTGLYRTHVVVEALAHLPDDVVVISTLAGADPDYVRRIERMATALGVSHRVRIVPPVGHDEIDDFYRLADVVVSIPVSDGTPVSLLEAMATGTPVVASDLPSIRPWLGEIAGDLLVPLDDPAATARALERALSLSPSERARIAAAERAVVVARADHAREMEAMEQAYRRLAAS